MNKEKIAELEKEVLEERSKLSSDRMDISFGELINLYKNGELLIRPEYQRLFRWDSTQKTALIESILLSIPIPPIFVSEDEDGVWELVDGLQRLSTLISFFGDLKEDLTKIKYKNDELEEEIDEDKEEISIINKWKLEKGGLIKSLEGFDIDDLPMKFKLNLKRAACRVEILRGESKSSMKYELFKRLNSGGSKLTPQEIRNAIYRGINTDLNELLLELSRNKSFISYINLSKKKKQELYDQELILRFIAFVNNVESVNDNTENYLNTFMENAVKNPSFDLKYYKKTFSEVFKLINKVGDDKIFRNHINQFVPAEFEGISVGVAQNLHLYADNIPLLKEKIKKLKEDKKFKKSSGSASNSKTRIKNRLTRANEIFS